MYAVCFLRCGTVGTSKRCKENENLPIKTNKPMEILRTVFISDYKMTDLSLSLSLMAMENSDSQLSSPPGLKSFFFFFSSFHFGKNRKVSKNGNRFRSMETMKVNLILQKYTLFSMSFRDTHTHTPCPPTHLGHVLACGAAHFLLKGECYTSTDTLQLFAPGPATALMSVIMPIKNCGITFSTRPFQYQGTSKSKP